MLRVNGCHLVFASLFLFGSLALARDFSADIATTYVDHKHKKEEVSQVFVSVDRLRIDARRAQSEGGHQITIQNEGTHHYYFLMPDQMMYVDAESFMMGRVAMLFWHVADAENACPDFDRLAAKFKVSDKVGTCSKVGPDTINGRSVVKL